LPGGQVIQIRPLCATDARGVEALFNGLSEDSSYERFLDHERCRDVVPFVQHPTQQGVALVASRAGDDTELIGLACYETDAGSVHAEVSLVVSDEWQCRGVGSALFRRLLVCAREYGLLGFTADVLATNGRMMALFRSPGLRVKSRLEGGVYRVDAAFC
jgi:ribosomal protein S18 acetylase RimI-like enzyme